MTMFQPEQPAARSIAPLHRLVWPLVALGIIGGIGIFASLVLTGVGSTVDESGTIALEDRAVILVIANYSFYVGLVAGVGALIVAGFLEVARRVVETLTQR